MQRLSALFLCAMLAACATGPIPEKPQHLFHDALFSAPSERISPDQIFALSDEMRFYLDNDIARKIHADGKIMALVNVLNKKAQLKLTYDATKTRNAAEAFQARSGNCLSLAIMTAAFARQMGLPIQFHSVTIGEVWDRKDNIDFLIGHVNLTLGETGGSSAFVGQESPKIIDFGAYDGTRGERMEDVGEDIIVAMYMNNRAAESLANGNLDNAYWWARAAIERAPAFLIAYNTLGVIYSGHHNLPEAEQVFQHVLEQEPENGLAMSNEVHVLNGLGRAKESEMLARRLAEIQPYPPYFFFNRGLDAMRTGDYRTARTQFTKEVNRASYNHQFHFWLALADFYLGNIDETRKQLIIAMENSPNSTQHDLYAAKLQSIRSHGVH
jgi:tetratricopeptide (TPR) repeat protein